MSTRVVVPNTNPLPPFGAVSTFQQQQSTANVAAAPVPVKPRVRRQIAVQQHGLNQQPSWPSHSDKPHTQNHLPKDNVFAFPNRVANLRGIARHLSDLQSWIDDPRHHRRLWRNLGKWNQMLSSLQALKQTNQAVTAFEKRGNKLNEGERFLAIYGLLQALVLQQDALCHLAEALQTTPVRLNRHRKLEEIRNIRNWSVGHPTKADRGPALSHHAIARPKLGRGGFSLHSSFDDGRFQYMYVPLPQLARLQRRVMSRILRDMLTELKAEVPVKKTKRKRWRPKLNPILKAKGHMRRVA